MSDHRSKLCAPLLKLPTGRRSGCMNPAPHLNDPGCRPDSQPVANLRQWWTITFPNALRGLDLQLLLGALLGSPMGLELQDRDDTDKEAARPVEIPPTPRY